MAEYQSTEAQIVTVNQPTEMPNEPKAGWRNMFSALKNPNYRYFYSGQSVSLIGTWTRTAALAWVTYQFTHSELWLGMVFMLNSLPIFLLAIYAGALADRVPKILIFKVTSWFSLLSSLTLALMLFHGAVHVAYLMIFSVLWGLSTTFEMPARQTLMVELVGKGDLVNAIALNSAMVNSTRVIGPAIGGLLLATVGAPWCFLVDALSYLAVLYALFCIKLPAAHFERKPGNRGWKYTLEGFQYLRTNSTIAQAVLLLSIMGLGGWAYQSQLSAFVVTQLHMGARGYGWVLAVNGLGACVAALTVAARGAQIVRVRTLYIGVLVYALSIIFFGASHHIATAAPLLFVAGGGIILFYSIGNSIIQTESPDHLRGRIMGIWALVFGGSLPLGTFLMGVIAQHFGPGRAMQIGGMVCGIAALLVCSTGHFRRAPM